MSVRILSAAAGEICHQLEPCHLLPSHADAMAALQAQAFAALPPQQRSFLIVKSADQLAANASSPNYAAGIINGARQLVAMGSLRPIIGGSADYLTPTVDSSHLNHQLESGPQGSAAVIGTVMVSPIYWRKGLMNRILLELLTAAQGQGFDEVYGEVAAENIASAKGFLHHGFSCVATGVDASDGTALQFYHLSLTDKGKVHERPRTPDRAAQLPVPRPG
jgi:RimJ/RimL family protein N-acetyltransferase